MDDGYLAEVRLWAGNFAPRGWMFCAGQYLPISQYTALFALIGTRYGGNGTNNFQLPNLMGRAVVGAGQGPGLDAWQVGEYYGHQAANLSIANLPAHTHNATIDVTLPSLSNLEGQAKILVSADGTEVSNEMDNGYLAQGGSVPGMYTPVLDGTATLKPTPVTGMTMSLSNLTASVTVGASGNSQSISLYQPSQALNYVICVEYGEWPPRN